ncbi:hypothetical protein NBH00_18500 [Paraconexibacter antarcticus]|uniref:Uncharacterized protein n=1 Tax=Paraconexibacter antarcticus TaxID=2949664 RepID=A0ABY5DNZ0_9ACTN|nr:hypothetical protein [Paraconexibacter antarcticus]UTI63334.1 hypothetical protein NBH00_18500 [Paraconexibacter antarcticus]
MAWGVGAGDFQGALLQAAASIRDAGHDPRGALPDAISRCLGHDPTPPGEVLYFHATRLADPPTLLRRGLYPTAVVLDELWDFIGRLAEPEITTTQWRDVRRAMDSGTIGADLPYRHRLDHRSQQGPCAALVLDTVLHAERYPGTVDYLAGAEIVVDICDAVAAAYDLPLHRRYLDATRPCIVEIIMPGDASPSVLDTAAWYVEAAVLGQTTSEAHWGIDGAGNQLVDARIHRIWDVTSQESWESLISEARRGSSGRGDGISR